MFSESTGYVTIGDAYDKKVPLDPRNVGLKCFVTQPGKRGNLPQSTFDWALRGKFIHLNEGDRYRDPGQNEKDKRREAREKTVAPIPFKYANPPKRSTGLGGYEGCFQTNQSHETDFDVIKKGEFPAKKEPAPRNFLTNPSRYGTYGVPGTLLSNAFGGANSGWAGTEYICDPYDGAKKIERAQRAKVKEVMADKVPFVCGCKRNNYFDESHNAGVSLVYKLKKPLAPRKPSQEMENTNVKDQPWKPNHQGKSGISGLFGGDEVQFPPYREDPYELRESREKQERDREKPKFGTWRPVCLFFYKPPDHYNQLLFCTLQPLPNVRASSFWGSFSPLCFSIFSTYVRCGRRELDRNNIHNTGFNFQDIVDKIH